MQKTTLIILLIMASLCSGLALSPGGFSAGNLLHYLASMYVPSDHRQNNRVMTFGRELIAEEDVSSVPQRTFLK